MQISKPNVHFSIQNVVQDVHFSYDTISVFEKKNEVFFIVDEG
jgi:hypothetical protein